MTAPTDALLWALARALAPARAVLLVGEPFEAMALLAECAVRELVVVSPDADPAAPAGATADGAPLRMRADLRERPASKDLIVDRAGTLPPESLARLLKKAGLYVTATPGAALESLPHRRGLPAGAVAGLATGGAPASPLCLGAAATGEPVLWVGGKMPLPPLPDVAAFGGPPPSPPELVDLGHARAEILRLDAELTRALSAYDTCRSELAERRTADRRVDLVRAAAESAQGRLLAEIEGLHRRLTELEAPGAERQDIETRRRQAEAQTRRVVGTVAALLDSQGLAECGAPPPVTAEEAVDLWMNHAADALRRQGRTLSIAERERQALADAVALAQAALAARQEPLATTAPPPAMALEPDAAERATRIRALTSALEAEHGLRLAERAELSRCHRLLEARQAQLTLANEALRATAVESARLRVAVATLDEQAHRMRRELALRDAGHRELEQLVRGHLEMQDLLTRALEAAEAALEAANANCHLADRNLELLRGELRAAELRAAKLCASEPTTPTNGTGATET